MLKVLHINTADTGGAAIAAIRIHLGLLENGISSSFLSLYKSKGGIPNHSAYAGPVRVTKPEYPVLTLKNLIREKRTSGYQKKMAEYSRKQEQEKQLKTPRLMNGFHSFGLFSFPDSLYDITKTKEYGEADIIHLHWVSEFLDYPSFFKINQKPVVWTLHDANPYRGGFHHEDDEIRNLDTHRIIDEEFKKIKKEAIAGQQKMTIVSPSVWLREEAVKSQVFMGKKVMSIPNGIDLDIFKPHDKTWAKKFFNIPDTIPVFLFASHDIHDYRKGLDLLLPLINSGEWKHVRFVLAGSHSMLFDQGNVLALGSISDQRLMSLVYAASDFFLLTSRTDNLPNTMVESIACGTPVIGFPIGDNRAILEESNCGIVADDVSTESLEKAMLKAIESVDSFKKEILAGFAVQHFDQKKQALLYLNEYKELIK